MKLSDIRDVTNKIESGGWVGELPNLPGVKVKVRGIFNSDYRRLLAKLRADIPPEKWDDPEIAETIDTQLLHETILVDWHGIEDAEYTPELAKQLLSDPEFAVFRRAVHYAGNIVAAQGKQSLEADAKNS
ncbi:hypothetical protein [Microvirga massiliensis]|uniref:hypothetical protein n=1 Tax=Microvirga massiliensis TaxID=1033741 RepID=UPI00062B5933|nr:hypothetical protein [Microvirga massiliensis]